MSRAVQRFSSRGIGVSSCHEAARIASICCRSPPPRPRSRRRSRPSLASAAGLPCGPASAALHHRRARTSRATRPGISQRRGARLRSRRSTIISPANQVGGILPTWQLLRTATSWEECGGQPFEVPPAEEWPHMVQTLALRARLCRFPQSARSRPVSVYRNPLLNKCAGGAPESAHKLDSAIDMVPLRPIDRSDADAEAVRRSIAEHGAAYNAGLGFYAYLRFHVDSTKFRRWNMDPAVAAECPPIVHPEDIASVGQPSAASAARVRRRSCATACQTAGASPSPSPDRHRCPAPRRTSPNAALASKPCVAYLQHHIGAKQRGVSTDGF